MGRLFHRAISRMSEVGRRNLAGLNETPQWGVFDAEG